ncbi:hypothetical protein C1H46_001230 [Malus baccata]|uniref:Uncharacterized protein n=1 Tax=Malus baccata TaxID=106549 RepID=A0A540NQ28_MALBA|nr:hypothetical protein C1H46_001230 [Malus baccata]
MEGCGPLLNQRFVMGIEPVEMHNEQGRNSTVTIEEIQEEIYTQTEGVVVVPQTQTHTPQIKQGTETSMERTSRECGRALQMEACGNITKRELEVKNKEMVHSPQKRKKSKNMGIEHKGKGQKREGCRKTKENDHKGKMHDAGEGDLHRGGTSGSPDSRVF